MNSHIMKEAIKIVNDRVIKMLNMGEINSEVFYRDVRTLTELIKASREIKV